MKKNKNKRKYTAIISSDIPSVVEENLLVVVGGKDYVKWTYFKCPCGCGDTLSLSLMKSVKPNWKLKIDKNNLPSLYPSIWRKDGCESHFWIRKGKLIWAFSYDFE